MARSSIRARRATFRSHFQSSPWSTTQIQTACDAVPHWILWPFYCAHHQSATPRSVQWSPVLRHTCRHETPNSVLHLFFPVYNLFFRWRHYCLPPPRPFAESRCILPSPHISPLPSPAHLHRFTKFPWPLDCSCLTLSFLLLSMHKALRYRNNAQSTLPRFVTSTCRTVTHVRLVRLSQLKVCKVMLSDCFL